jgi:small conductance mechanosensitive channel
VVTRYGNLETMTVRSPLSNRNLFTIAAPTVYDRSANVPDQVPVEQRAKEIQAKLLLLLQRDMNPATLMFGVSQLNSVTIITVRNDQYPQPLVLASVTSYDAEFNGLPPDQLATQWRDILEADLRDGLTSLPEDRQRVYRMLMGLVLITAIIVGVKYTLGRRQRKLKHQQQNMDAAANESEADAAEFHPVTPREEVEQQQANSLQKLRQDTTVGRRLATLDFFQWLLFWLLILTWYGAAAWVFAVSPYLLVDALGFFDKLIALLTIWFLTGLTIRLSRRLIDYVSVERDGLDIGDFLTYGDAHRRQIRVNTIAGALKGLLTTVIALVGGLLALAKLGMPTASVLAIGSLAGLAITFGSQNLVKDLVNGFFILAEDQYAVGDVIDVGTASGLVEALNMRVTQIRSSDGELITVPNSAIAQVKNLTRSWSRIAFQIEVAYQNDPRFTLQVLEDLSNKFYNDPEWHDQMIAEPEVLGIDSVTHRGMTITIWIRTQPAQQWAVGREFRLRVREALEEHGIEIGVPKQTYQFEPSSIGDYSSEPAKKGP